MHMYSISGLHFILFSYSTASATIFSPSVDNNVTVIEQDNVTLTCIARGFPVPVISWHYEHIPNDGIIITSAIPVYIDSLVLYTVESTLTIPQSTRHSSERYSCMAINTITGSIRTDMKAFDVTVKCKSDIVHLPIN